MQTNFAYYLNKDYTPHDQVQNHFSNGTRNRLFRKGDKVKDCEWYMARWYKS